MREIVLGRGGWPKIAVDAMMLITTINFALYVCLCRGVTDRTISAEIARGACTVEEIAACTGAGTKCGRCRAEVAEMISSSEGFAEVAEVTLTSIRPARRVALPVFAEGDAIESGAEAANETRAA